MGRLPIATAGGGDSSPPSAESSFRELDEVFLQTQTRIWLGEVLNIRLDEDLHISDLLQDGEILFEVSKVVWNLLLTKCMELRHLKHKYGPFGSKKSSGRYRPYSNVDSFLKICKILGLTGIDLFSPSDVVEKRDIRKVCICIRALSKKARSKQLSVPDFDVVMYSVAMPTDMVGGIRRSLELSQCTLSSSSSYSLGKASQMRLQQKKTYVPSGRDDDSLSQDSDEAESRYMGENSCSPSSNSDRAAALHTDLEDSSDSHSFPHVNYEVRHTFRNGISENDFSPENGDSVVGDSSCVKIGENNYISDYLAFSDLMVHASDGNSSVILEGENNMFDFFLHADSQGLNLDKGSLHNDEDMEVSSTTSMSSVLGRMLNLEFDDQFDPDESLITNVYSSGSMEFEIEKHYKDPVEIQKIEMSESQSSTTLLFDSQEVESKVGSTMSSDSTQYFSPSLSKFRLSEAKSCDTRPGNQENTCFLENGEIFADNNYNLEGLIYDDKENEAVGTSLLGSDSDLLQNGRHQKVDTIPVVSDDTNADSSTFQGNKSETISEKPIGRVHDEFISSAAENEYQEKGKLDLKFLEENISDRKETRPEIPPAKNVRKPLLKTVVKGTAIAGVLFLLLHIRKNRGNSEQEIKPSSKHNKSTFSLKKQQSVSGGKGAYPAGKLKL